MPAAGCGAARAAAVTTSALPARPTRATTTKQAPALTHGRIDPRALRDGGSATDQPPWHWSALLRAITVRWSLTGKRRSTRHVGVSFSAPSRYCTAIDSSPPREAAVFAPPPRGYRSGRMIVDKSLEQLEAEERAVSRQRRRLHRRIEYLQGTAAREARSRALLAELVAQEGDVSARRRRLHAMIDTLSLAHLAS